MHPHAILAVMKRQLGSFLGNPVGYIFILLFVCVTGAFLFWQDSFYQRGIADFAPIYGIMPFALAVLLPALAMGAWTTEKEKGTEELVLTLPISVLDAVVGKYLAIAILFTIAMVANLSNVVVLAWLGNPDVGLILANYFGWWFGGLAFAALGLWASVQVRSQAIAFVLGVIYSGIILVLGFGLDWMEPFQRGVFSIGNMLMAFAVIGVGLGLTLLWLSARLWRAEQQEQIVFQVVNMVLAVVLAINIGQWFSRSHLDVDISFDGISSISQTSKNILGELENPVRITAFLSDELPEQVSLKAKEIVDTIAALERAGGTQLETRILRPTDVVDRAATIAQNTYGLQPRKMPGDTVTGRDMLDVFLSAVVTSRGISQTIEYFEPGLSVEYELVRAIRTVQNKAANALPVVGVVQTEVKMTDDFNFQMRQNQPAWELVQELRRQYEVRDVFPDNPITDDIDVLVVPIPSGLTAEQMVNVHDFIYAGGPTLMMVDPFPYFELNSGRQIAPSLPRFDPQQQQQMPGMPPPESEPKGDINKLMRALGLRADLGKIAWSSYAPNTVVSQLPPTIVWSTQEKGGILESPITKGMDKILTVYPAVMKKLDQDDVAWDIGGLEHTPLLTISEGAPWGTKRFDDFIMQTPYGMQPRDPGRFIGSRGQRPWLAVEVAGTMPRAFVPESADGDNDPDESEDASDGIPKEGDLSENKMHVIVIGDLDLGHDNFFSMYRNIDSRNAADLQKLWASLNNVQLVANAVDALAGDTDFIALRNRRAKHRMLSRMQDVVNHTELQVSQTIEEVEEAKDAKRVEAQAVFDAKIKAIRERDDLDEQSKANEVAAVQKIEQRKLEKKNEKLDNEALLEVRKARALQREQILADRMTVKILAIGVPALLLLLLIVIVAALRIVRERTDIPAARQRSAA